MGMSPESYYRTTADRITIQFQCLFIVENAGSIVKGLVAFGQTFVTEAIQKTVGMVVVKHQMQPLRD